MKRVFEEISDEEWEDHDFNLSRILKKEKSPPPIESFAYQRPSRQNSDQNGGRFIQIDEDLEDDDVEVTEVTPPANRARRFVVEDSDEDLPQVFEIRSDEEDVDEVARAVDEYEDEADEEDVVGKALQKCARISASLRRELYGSSARSCDRYAEVETSTARIVTQEDIDAACTTDESDFQPILKPYQLVGVNFLLLLYRKNIGGAILADEMGLGKTIQAITYLTLLKHLDNDPGPHLIVCPASVLENWERELRKWCPSFSILQYHGAGRTAYSKELNSLAKSGLPPPFNVLLVCYSLFERHSIKKILVCTSYSAQQKDDRKALKRWRWSCVLMDEAHVLKDKNSYRWKNLMSVAQNAQQRLMLTGTPLQNDLHELWSLLEFMMPDIFATGDVDLKKLLNSEDMVLIARIKSILGPFILRRLKSDVMQQLVPKIQEVKYVFMETEQAEAYKEAIDEYRTASQARLAKLADVTTNNVAAMFPKRQVSNYFVQFRKIANHPLLVRRIYSDEDVVRFARMLHPKGAFGFECTLDRVIEELKGYNDFAIHRLLVYYYGITARGALSEEHVLLSAKCKALAELLPSLKDHGHRVLIFSQWTAMLDILEWALDVIGVTYLRLDGSTQVTERQTIVDTFNNDPSIFACLLSTRAGGQGLNLIGADTVVIHDMDFNPQMDRQAEDRCHRIGQTKPVTIYRLVTKGTVDENVYEIAKRKLILDAAVLENGMDLENENALSEKTMGEILSALLLG
ncbi:protein CHROMATIN REMODELING 19 [Cinnamomum micranthum f. kanehirae]|uniref:Protein CHROMATIN REMODELING 19 n=1 Tax=Cinnamomum micranthum f. kanehirae TaxID=337451 RepID=A0A3S3NRF7_9MAGN|nr:protein CHROMATIN REMODELING 19 [Cinnamomum micranthum f. kanehirae]